MLSGSAIRPPSRQPSCTLAVSNHYGFVRRDGACLDDLHAPRASSPAAHNTPSSRQQLAAERIFSSVTALRRPVALTARALYPPQGSRANRLATSAASRIRELQAFVICLMTVDDPAPDRVHAGRRRQPAELTQLSNAPQSPAAVPPARTHHVARKNPPSSGNLEPDVFAPSRSTAEMMSQIPIWRSAISCTTVTWS